MLRIPMYAFHEAAWLLAAWLLLSMAPPLLAQEAGLRLGADEWPPYEYLTDDGMSGIATEVVLEALRRMDRPVADVGYYPWKRNLMLLENARLDIVFSGMKTPDRLRYARYHATPLFDVHWVLFTQRGSPLRTAVSRLEDLDGYSVCATQGFSYTPEIDAYLDRRGRVVRKSTGAKGFYLLANGRVDFLICDKRVGDKLVHLLGLGDCVEQVDGPPLASTYAYAIFCRKTVSASMVMKFDAALRAIKDEGLFDKICSAHLRHYLR